MPDHCTELGGMPFSAQRISLKSSISTGIHGKGKEWIKRVREMQAGFKNQWFFMKIGRTDRS
jgi:hypothetical protein